ncbi:hypothetical protein HS327_00562 [Glaesserella parasuis]|uniref:Uncharacterized protein n=1 Tax=Actinobacillus sp. TaxID=41114 RepID=A0A894TE36_9PAST|nr:hypothetical protein HS327_00562 [Glaesserella parasuis]QRX38432.1 hypothetical protein [Actinobacillus sp.]QHB36482.1 hypothetical protein [Glaesserella parasuis]QOW02301.1 hypothetical protein [Glaesserella parasuis]QOW02400.1 hypothetical protein [Glaesserella parasuis]
MLEKSKIHILLSAVGDRLSKDWKERANFTDDLKKPGISCLVKSSTF